MPLSNNAKTSLKNSSRVCSNGGKLLVAWNMRQIDDGKQPKTFGFNILILQFINFFSFVNSIYFIKRTLWTSYSTCKIYQCWIPVCNMQQAFTLDSSSTEHVPMNKTDSSHPSLPQSSLLSTEWPVESTVVMSSSIISCKNHQGVIPQPEKSKSRVKARGSLIIIRISQ